MADLSSNPDNLIPFLKQAAANQKANIANFPAPYHLLRRVDSCLSTAGKNLINPKPVLAGFMLLRCQYAYKAARRDPSPLSCRSRRAGRPTRLRACSPIG